MDETQLIRAQLALERGHLAAAAQACAQALTHQPDGTAGFHQACVEYLDGLLGRYQARDERVAQLAAGLGSADPRCSTVNEILARAGSAGEARTRLAAAAATPAAWPDFVQFLGSAWGARRDALEQLLVNDSRVIDWRLFGGVDADGILEERRGFAQLAALVPAGVSLGAPSPRAG